jgi:hypothetical protein
MFIKNIFRIIFIGTPGNLSDQSDVTYGIERDSSTGILYIVDYYNALVISYASGTSSGTKVAGGNAMGTNTNQLNHPFDLYFDSISKSFY